MGTALSRRQWPLLAPAWPPTRLGVTVGRPLWGGSTGLPGHPDEPGTGLGAVATPGRWGRYRGGEGTTDEVPPQVSPLVSRRGTWPRRRGPHSRPSRSSNHVPRRKCGRGVAPWYRPAELGRGSQGRRTRLGPEREGPLRGIRGAGDGRRVGSCRDFSAPQISAEGHRTPRSRAAWQALAARTTRSAESEIPNSTS